MQPEVPPEVTGLAVVVQVVPVVSEQPVVEPLAGLPVVRQAERPVAPLAGLLVVPLARRGRQPVVRAAPQLPVWAILGDRHRPKRRTRSPP